MLSIYDGVTYKEYVYLNGMKVAVVEDGNISYIHNNYLGVPKVITDSSGAVVWEGDYKPFGEMYDVNGTISNNIRFPGQYQNEESGYSYNYYRDYDATIGRYLQSDPIGLNGGINTYGYVSANPINKYDPYGLWEYAKEYNTSGQGLSARMKAIESAVDKAANEVFKKDATVTYSTNGEHGLKNGGKSFHYSGDAVDLRTRGLTKEERQLWVDKINEYVDNPKYQVIDEVNHLHIEYDDGSIEAPTASISLGNACAYGITEF